MRTVEDVSIGIIGMGEMGRMYAKNLAAAGRKYAQPLLKPLLLIFFIDSTSATRLRSTSSYAQK
jgi:3-hydroxyisobutyrate dehydrogenase-like beta-hydroxyacid dehydrogenase